MSDANWALQQALFAELSANSDVQAALGDPPRLYDAVPRDAVFPYAVLGDGQENDASTATEQGSEHILAIHIWSRARRPSRMQSRSPRRSAMRSMAPRSRSPASR